MNSQHKWSKEIKLWADGFPVETKYGEDGIWYTTLIPKWDCEYSVFRAKLEFEIPKIPSHPNPNWVWLENEKDCILQYGVKCVEAVRIFERDQK